jgi:spore coat protein U-like protein
VKTRVLSLALVVAAALAWSVPARAVSCTISATVPVAFGAYDRTSGTALDSSGSVTYQCGIAGLLDVLTITMSTGNGTYASRTMLNGANPMSYNLYTNAGRTTVWGDGSSGTAVYGPVTLNLLAITVPVYGRIPPGQNVAVGSFSDTIVVTLNF